MNPFQQWWANIQRARMARTQPFRYGLGDMMNSLVPWGTSAREQDFATAQQNRFANATVTPYRPPVQRAALGRVASPTKQAGVDYFGKPLPTDPSRVIRYAPGQNTGLGLTPAIVGRGRTAF